MRDHGLLESALYRPQTSYYADLIEEAAALWESLAQNHPFIDGNKRTAFAAIYTFLAINGTVLTVDSGAAYDFISGLYEKGAFSFDNVLPWLRIYVKFVSSRRSLEHPGGSYDLRADAMEPTRCRKLREREAARSRCSPIALDPATFW